MLNADISLSKKLSFYLLHFLLSLVSYSCFFFYYLLYLNEKDSNNESLEKLIKQYSQMFDLCAPMKGCVISQGRYLFLEGDMKYKDNITKVCKMI